MHANDLLWTLRHRSELGDGDGAGIGREDRISRQDAVEVAEDLSFDGKFFSRRFDSEAATAKSFAVERRRDPGFCIVRLLLGKLIFCYFASGLR
jgi:hypothetical protein